MNIDEVLLTNEEHSEVFRRMPRLIARGEEGLEPRINKAQCLKLLEWLEKEEQIHHTYRYTLKYPYKRLGCSPTCKLCELESKLKEG